jgi:hypothetical protein
MINALSYRLTAPVENIRATTIFCKGLFMYFLLKIFFTWSTLSQITSVHSFSKPKLVLSWMAFGFTSLAAAHIHIFLSMTCVVLILAILIRPNYFLSAFIALLALNFYKICFTVANGSDQIMVTMLFFAVPLSAYPILKNPSVAIVQSGVYNTARWLCMFYVASIYLISGLDKLGTQAWRSGDAIESISHLEYMMNPGLKTWIPEGSGSRLVLAWLAIAFELSFAALVWFRPIRKWLFAAGILFHFVIGAFLSLPDFGWIMVISYLIFLDDETIGSAIRIFARKRQ